MQGIFDTPASTALPAGATPDVYYVSIWVGLDGWGNDIVFQAGVTVATELFSDGSTETVYWAWYEWYPQGSIVITNFPVSPGDTIAIALTEVSPAVGNILYENLSQGVAVQGDIGSPEPSADIQGLSAEWIVEDPGQPEVPFLGFGTVVFQDCLAETSTGEELTLADATLLSLITVSGDTITGVLTDETLLDDTDLQVVYVGP